jgi:hypothetical protein
VDNDGVLTMNVDYGGGNCYAPNYVGRLPWRTLGLPELRDADGETLWYALAATFRDMAGIVINDGTVSALSVAGTTPAGNVVAVVFAPGPSLSSLGQARGTTAERNSAANYLEGANAAGGPAFAAQAPDDNFHDGGAFPVRKPACARRSARHGHRAAERTHGLLCRPSAAQPLSMGRKRNFSRQPGREPAQRRFPICGRWRNGRHSAVARRQ